MTAANAKKKIKTYVIPDYAQPGLEKNKDRSRHIKKAKLQKDFDKGYGNA